MKLRRRKEEKPVLVRPPKEYKALSTDEVTELCEDVVDGTDCRFMGTFSALGGPSTVEWVAAARSRDSAFVANTDLKENDGTHWCLFFLPKDETRKPYFFDSFARDPHAMGRHYWTNYLAETSRLRGGDGTWDRQPFALQDPDTAVCGHLCAIALLYLSRGIHVPDEIPHCKIDQLLKIKRKS
jgi:hypothetical protein